jgi:pimeloyl-ACP methyl ester carboxylesterase
MHVIPVRDTALSSLALGEEGARPAVLIHGLLFGNMATWYTSLAGQLADTHRVVLYDQRGHGDSPVAMTGYDMRTQVEDLQGVLSHHGMGEDAVDVVGHSMGAVIALQFALRHPERVRRLVLVDAPLPLQRHVLPELLAVDRPEVLAGYIGERQQKAAERRLRRIHRRLDGLFFNSTMVADLTAEPEIADDAIARLTLPVLLVYGRGSECLDAGRHLDRLLPRARLELLDCGHYVVEESPAELRRLVIPFLVEAV